MTIQESHRVLIGATGWLHESWKPSFYPEDLPGDWQLAYYANEFPVVMVRDKEWQQAGKPQQWLDETEELPLFICELPLQQISSDWLNRAKPYLESIKQLGERCIAIVCSVAADIPHDVLQELLAKCNELAPTSLNTNAKSLLQLNSVLQQSSVNPVYSATPFKPGYGDDVMIAMLDSSDVDLKSVRQALEGLLECQGRIRLLVLLFAGDSPDLEMTRQAKLMLELL